MSKVFNMIGGGKSTKDATISSADVMRDKIAYGADGKVVGDAPFAYVNGSRTMALPGVYSWTEIIYGDGKYVTVNSNADSTMAAYSEDGCTWIATTMPAGRWYGLAYGKGRFVSVASVNAAAAYSDDGIVWVPSELPMDTSWSSIAYGGGRFVALSINNTDCVAYSEDGSIWSQSAMPEVASWRKVVHDGEKFVAVGYTNTGGACAYSIDGITWTSSSMAAECKPWNIAYNGSRFVAIGYNSDTAAYSDDGITWTATTMPQAAKWCVASANKDLFVCTTYSSDILAYSLDGIVWLETTMPFVGGWYGICWDGEQFVAVAGSSDRGARSADGITWNSGGYEYACAENEDIFLGGLSGEKRKLINTSSALKFDGDYTTADATVTARNLAFDKIAYGPSGKITGKAPFVYKDAGIKPVVPDDSNYWAMAYGNGCYVAVGPAGVAASSTDGITWTEVSLPTTEDYVTVAFGNGRFVALEDSTGGTAYSSDGITWTKGSSVSDWWYLCYGGGKFVAVGNDSVMYSSDGLTWTEVSASKVPGSMYCTAVTYGGGKFVALASSSGMYSTDGATWTEVPLPASGKWHGIAYGDDRFVAVASGSDIAMWSLDGLTWTLSTLPRSQSWSYFAYENGVFVATGADYSAYSTDGITWGLSGPHNGTLNCFGSGGGKFIRLNFSGSALLSVNGATWYSEVQPLYEIVNYGTIGIRLTAGGDTETVLSIVNGEVKGPREDWAGSLTFTGTKATSTYFTEAGCSLAVDPIRGMAFVTIQGGTSTSYENILFNATSLPSGVKLLAAGGTNYGSGSAKQYFTAALTGITGKINVKVDFTTTNSTNDYTQADLTVTYAE